MSKKTLVRKYRTGKLTAADVARDEEIRRKVKAEFPPFEADPISPVLSQPLKKAIAESQKSVRQLAKDASVSPIVLTQFLEGHRDLRLATVEKLALVLGLKLVAS